jgi:hypothetical protein
VESYRNAEHRVYHRSILNVGFIEDLTAYQLNKIEKQLPERCGNLQSVFQEQDDPTVNKYVENLWQHIIDSKILIFYNQKTFPEC